MDIVYTDSIIDPIDGLSNIRISWDTPEANGEFISKYQIKILSSDGVTYYENLANCDGSNP